MSENSSPAPSGREGWLYWGAWVFAIGTLTLAGYFGWRVWKGSLTPRTQAFAAVQQKVPETTAEEKDVNIPMPAIQVADMVIAISRRADLHTIIPTRPRQDVFTYTVETGDSVFGIAQVFAIKPETILWANYDILNDNPDMLSPGMELKIPPVDGVLYEWQEGDTLKGVSEHFEAKTEDVLNWSGNKLDLTDPQFNLDQLVMLPGGHREFRQWLVPTIPRGAAGVSRALYGGGACAGGYEGAFGTGGFIWPADNHYLSGNDYWSGHLAIDIAAGMGAPIYAADSGVIVFAGSATGGYGNMIMIDHGNGYQTLYAHLSQVYAHCGSSVSQGQVIGYAGSTGKSTGAHLHFEVRYLGGFIDPWYVLPAP